MLLSNDIEELHAMVEDLNIESKKVSLTMNVSKIKVMTNIPIGKCIVGGKEIEIVGEYNNYQ